MRLGTLVHFEIKAGFEKASGKWIELESAQYKTYDGSHLTIKSAKELSDKIGLYLKELVENEQKFIDQIKH